jgi:hypothetical protein
MRRVIIRSVLPVLVVGSLSGPALACSCVRPDETAQRRLIGSVGAIYQLTIEQAAAGTGDQRTTMPPQPWLALPATVHGVWKGPVVGTAKVRVRAPQAAPDPCGHELPPGYRGTWAFTEKDATGAWLPVSGCPAMLWKVIDGSGQLPGFLGRETPQIAPR